METEKKTTWKQEHNYFATNIFFFFRQWKHNRKDNQMIKNGNRTALEIKMGALQKNTVFFSTFFYWIF